MQSPKQVIDNLLRKRPADRVGLHEYIWPDTLRAWTEQGYPKDDKGQPADFAEHFALDMVQVNAYLNHYPRREVYEPGRGNRPVARASRRMGRAAQVLEEQVGHAGARGLRYDLAQVWEKDYRPRMLELDVGRLKVDEAKADLERRRAKGGWTYTGHGLVWETMRQSMGDICLYESMVLDEAWIADVCQVLTAFFQTHYKYLFQQIGLPDGVWIYEDLGYKHRLFCSPELYGRMIFPYYRQMVDFYHAYGLPVVLHTCGFVEPALDLVVEAGFDAIHPMEVKAGNDPLRIARRYKDKLAIVGGLDARILETHDPALIRKETAALVEGMKAAGARYVFASDHSLSTNVRYDDFRVAVDAYREHMYY